MKKQFFAFIFLLLFTFNAPAQVEEARKSGELLSYWECDHVISVSDTYLFELQNSPKSTGFVIFYEGKYANDIAKLKTKMLLPRRGEANFRIQIIRNHVKLRNSDSSKILFIDGGFREEHKIEFWLVPDGAELPKPTPTLDSITYRKGKPKWRCDL